MVVLMDGSFWLFYVCLSTGLTFELTMKGPLGAPAGITGETCTHTHTHTHTHSQLSHTRV